MSSKFAIFVLLIGVNSVFCFDAKGFDDTILFDLDWPGSKSSLQFAEDSEFMVVKTKQDESYKCYLPQIEEKTDESKLKYSGPTPFQLIAPLFVQSQCSYRLESYWTYEICHGRYVRQYHEERENKKMIVQEYLLGKWDKENFDLIKNLEASNLNSNLKESETIPHKKIDGINLPYYEIWMENGTLCDLNNNKPRKTRILYVCYIHGKHEIYSLKETSTCLYEIIVLSPLLCAHPKYKPKDSGEHKINCLPLNGSPDKPKAMVEVSPFALNKEKHKQQKLYQIYSVDLDQFHIKMLNKHAGSSSSSSSPSSSSELHNENDNLNLNEENLIEASILRNLRALPETLKDTTPIESFFLGKSCLHGGNVNKGNDFWKFEFCYGKHIEQYHLYEDGHRSSITLGVFDKETHLDWLEVRPEKKPKPKGKRDHISQFYSMGSVCDRTGKPRQTEVRLRCLQNPTSPNQVSLYLLEPEFCKYILGVESPVICKILDKADDETGLIDNFHEIFPNALKDDEQEASSSSPEKATENTANINIIRV